MKSIDVSKNFLVQFFVFYHGRDEDTHLMMREKGTFSGPKIWMREADKTILSRALLSS